MKELTIQIQFMSIREWIELKHKNKLQKNKHKLYKSKKHGKIQKELKRLNLLRCNGCKKIKSIENFPKANTCTYLCADCLKKYYKKWYNENGRNRNKESVKAGTILNKAIREGKIQRLTYCQICPKNGGKISSHHYDYSKPLEVIWSCPSCHRRIHSNHLETISDIETLKTKLKRRL